MKNLMRMLPLLLLLVLASCEIVEAPFNPGPSVDQPRPSPTLVPPTAEELLAQAQERRAVGDDAGSNRLLSELLDRYPAALEGRAARYYRAEGLARQGLWTEAVSAFQAFSQEPPPPDAHTGPALFWLARGYESIGDHASAVATYERYKELATPLQPYATMRQAAQQQALGQLNEAASNFEAAARAEIVRSERASSYERAISLRRQLGQNDAALALQKELIEFAVLPAYRARLLAEGAALAQEMGQTEQARRWLLELAASGTGGDAALSAVDQLLAANDPELSRATAATMYFNAERYEAALPLFDEALSQASAADSLTLQRLRALTLRSLGRWQEALDGLEAVRVASPDSDLGRQARLDWVQTLGQSGETEAAIGGYRDYAITYATDGRAPEALDRVAQLLERLNRPDEAEQTRLDLAQRYPQSEQATRALDTVAMARFRAGRYAEAQATWQQLASSRSGIVQARAEFWGARAARLNQANANQAQALFEAARAAAPDSYYGARAVDELSLTPAASVALGTPIAEDDWRGLEDWVAGWSGQPLQRVGESGFAPEVRDSGAVGRAQALDMVGLSSEALAEWNSARQSWNNDPTKLLHMARLAHEQAQPYVALNAAERLAALAPPTAPPQPIALRRLIFPTPYPELVLEESRKAGVDPLLFYSLLRQESLFNPNATSSAGARGLAQVMPSTAEGIAQRLGVQPFSPDDLYHPEVSVRFGTFYLSQRIRDMEGSVQAGLASYNGGLGNAMRWAGGTSVPDPDMFIEGIDFRETRNYVWAVYGFYGTYRQLYSVP
ncbi:MAG: transglycosylase SLT domain-containing protein [Chloroflexaceae bacterium]|nr:transglycosylase SLT domain-containing protein [Chloroflexaceae bacterium]